MHTPKKKEQQNDAKRNREKQEEQQQRQNSNGYDAVHNEYWKAKEAFMDNMAASDIVVLSTLHPLAPFRFSLARTSSGPSFIYPLLAPIFSTARAILMCYFNEMLNQHAEDKTTLIGYEWFRIKQKTDASDIDIEYVR